MKLKSKVYSLAFSDDNKSARNFIMSELHPHFMRKPKKMGWFESEETFAERKIRWEEKRSVLVDKFIDYFKEEFPDFYEDKSWTLINYGFSAGSYKTYFAYIAKLDEGEDNEA